MLFVWFLEAPAIFWGPQEGTMQAPIVVLVIRHWKVQLPRHWKVQLPLGLT